LTGSAGRVLPARGQSFTLELKQPRFDRAGTTKSPQQACQPMNELELDRCSRINTAALVIWLVSRGIRAPRKGIETWEEQIGFHDLDNNRLDFGMR
jgi:hypothetical protein